MGCPRVGNEKSKAADSVCKLTRKTHLTLAVGRCNWKNLRKPHIKNPMRWGGSEQWQVVLVGGERLSSLAPEAFPITCLKMHQWPSELAFFRLLFAVLQEQLLWWVHRWARAKFNNKEEFR